MTTGSTSSTSVWIGDYVTRTFEIGVEEVVVASWNIGGVWNGIVVFIWGCETGVTIGDYDRVRVIMGSFMILS